MRLHYNLLSYQEQKSKSYIYSMEKKKKETYPYILNQFWILCRHLSGLVLNWKPLLKASMWGGSKCKNLTVIFDYTIVQSKERQHINS